ncbi:MAG: excinuclease ABC subunit UvrC [Geobacteraceae bacterium]|nr:excinuclease ABC subunit UvrC [Geobacteraceae bacterium]
MKPEKTDTFPTSPGVYIMRNAEQRILYVGKAKNLRVRVRSYFNPSRDARYQIRFLMARVADIDYIVTDTEKEALILENTLIKKHRPRYNINLRDDKTYFSLRMDPAEKFPRITIIRRVTRDGARYFGPYSSASAARDVLKQLYRLFPLRHYPMETCQRRKRPCLFYQLRQCSGPCQGLIAADDYRNLAEGAALFLEGKNRDLLKVLTKKMSDAAQAEKYEEAARLRDLIRAIEVTVEKQKMVTEKGDFDVLGYARQEQQLTVALLFIRGGSLIGNRNFTFPWEMDDAEGISSFLNEYYSRDEYIPTEILLPMAISEPEALEDLLSEKRGKKVAISVPRRGTKAELVQLAVKNAETTAQEQQRNQDATSTMLTELQQRLHLSALPRRIECYDISTMQGKHAVGSKVAFQDGVSRKEEYRRYRIKNITQADDYGMMHEVLTRRFSDRPAEDMLPDLILVDGGPGQLNVLVRVLEDLGITEPDAASLAKSRVESEAGGSDIRRSDERVFLPGRKNPVVLRQNSAPLLLLARIRDEAHRFAISYHKKLRSKENIGPSVEKIPGIGKKRWKKLLLHFGSLKGLQKATVKDLTEIPGISEQIATTISKHLHRT